MILQIFRRKRNLSNLPRPSQMEIICGDCGGDEIYPRKTFLMTDGSCADCGGRDFADATRVFTVLARHLLSQKTEEVNK